jgi:predicted HicB family RNase H-like nuclease
LTKGFESGLSPTTSEEGDRQGSACFNAAISRNRRGKNKMMKHKSYTGTVWFDDEAEIFSGEVLGIRDVVTFQGKTVVELKKAFKESVDDYLDFCAERGETPDKPFSGQFPLRATAEDHRVFSLAAAREHKSLNAWAVEKLKKAALG